MPDQTYGFEYTYRGSRYILNIVAGSEAEARGRLHNVSQFGVCVGTLQATIPAAPGAGLLARVICWWKNL